MSRHGTFICENCGKQTLHVRDAGPNHLLHLILTIFTGGLWLLVWLMKGADSTGSPYRCTQCGTPTNSGGWGIAGAVVREIKQAGLRDKPSPEAAPLDIKDSSKAP